MRSLNLSADSRWALHHRFSGRGHVQEALQSLPFSASYAKKALRKIGETTANSVIALTWHKPIGPMPPVGDVSMVGKFQFDEKARRADEVVSSALKQGVVSVWAGVFKTMRQFEKYFNLPDHVIRNNDFDYPNTFARDFKIKEYPMEHASYFVTPRMACVSFSDLIEAFWFDSKLKKRICADANAQKIDLVNAVYVVPGFDYRALLKADPCDSSSRYDFRFVDSLLHTRSPGPIGPV